MKETYQRIWNRVEPKADLLEQTSLRMAEEPAARRSPVRRSAAVCCMLALLLIVSGWLSGPGRSDPFTLVAYAADGTQTPLARGERLPLQVHPESASLSGRDTTEVLYRWTLSFRCEGEQIESLTFSTDKGDFLRKYRLSFKECADYELKERLGIIESHYFEGEERFDEGYAEAYALEGKQFTVPYAEQDSRTYCYQSMAEGKAGMELDENLWLEGFATEITIKAHFKDGRTAEKEVLLAIDGEGAYAIEQ